MTTTMISYRGDLVAIASPLRVHFAPPLDTRPATDPLRRFVYAMALYAHDVATGELDEPYDVDRAELYARAYFIGDDEFRLRTGAGDQELAERFGVPLEQIALKRGDLATRTAADA